MSATVPQEFLSYQVVQCETGSGLPAGKWFAQFSIVGQFGCGECGGRVQVGYARRFSCAGCGTCYELDRLLFRQVSRASAPLQLEDDA